VFDVKERLKIIRLKRLTVLTNHLCAPHKQNVLLRVIDVHVFEHPSPVSGDPTPLYRGARKVFGTVM
jgi:hypothetical protein